MCGYESYAQEGGHCTCADPDFNVVIDPVLYPNGATLNQLQSAYPFFAGNAMANTCLSIDGHLIVNKNFTITGGEIIMAPGAEITVQGSRIFSLVDVDANGGVHGCTRMWRGIRFGGMSARINVVRSEIRDAQFAINSSVNAGAIYAEDATFWNNYISIRLMPNSIPGPFPVFNGTALELDGNLFSTDGQYLPAYNGQAPDPASSIYTGTGIWAEYAQNAVIGRASYATNIFEALNFGIYALDSRITVTNCAFLDIAAGIFPNPGRGEFYLQLPDTESGIAEIRIFALDGRLAFQAAVPAGGRSELGLAQLEAGLYFYQVWDGNRRLLDGKLCKVK